MDEADLGEALRRTLKPHVGTATLAIRFNVPRSKLSDTTAHSVIMIVRELVTNAIRHGKATEFWGQSLRNAHFSRVLRLSPPVTPPPQDTHLELSIQESEKPKRYLVAETNL